MEIENRDAGTEVRFAYLSYLEELPIEKRFKYKYVG